MVLVSERSRRSFLQQAGFGAVAVGAVTVAPGLFVGTGKSESVPTAGGAADPVLEEPLLAHVRDAHTGEIALLIGSREVVCHDRDLVARLIRAAG